MVLEVMGSITTAHRIALLYIEGYDYDYISKQVLYAPNNIRKVIAAIKAGRYDRPHAKHGPAPQYIPDHIIAKVKAQPEKQPGPKPNTRVIDSIGAMRDDGLTWVQVASVLGIGVEAAQCRWKRERKRVKASSAQQQ